MYNATPKTGEPPFRRRIFLGKGDVIAPNYFSGEIKMESPGSGVINIANDLTPAEREYREQKEAFENIPPLLLREYLGRFVIAHNGQILDSDTNLTTLTRRFFGGRDRNKPVFIAPVGIEEEESIETPFFD